MPRRLATAALLAAALAALLWLLWPRVDTGGAVVARPLPTPEIAAAPIPDPGADEVIRARRRPPREDRPLLEPVEGDAEVEPGWVVCALDGIPPGTPGAVIFAGGTGGPLRAGEGEVRFRTPEGATAARLTFDGYGGADVILADGRCVEPASFEAGPAVVTGMVTHADGRPAGKVWVQGCGRRVATDVDGAYYLEARQEQPCEVRAFRRDGVFTIWSEAAAVTPRAGVDTIADLALPPYQSAGLGAEVRETEEGILILRTLVGSAAHEAGLTGGDVVVEIDGEPTAGLTLREFVERALGPEGTEVELVIAGEEERIVELRRTTIDQDEG